MAAFRRTSALQPIHCGCGVPTRLEGVGQEVAVKIPGNETLAVWARVGFPAHLKGRVNRVHLCKPSLNYTVYEVEPVAPVTEHNTARV